MRKNVLTKIYQVVGPEILKRHFRKTTRNEIRYILMNIMKSSAFEYEDFALYQYVYPEKSVPELGWEYAWNNCSYSCACKFGTIIKLFRDNSKEALTSEDYGYLPDKDEVAPSARIKVNVNQSVNYGNLKHNLYQEAVEIPELNTIPNVAQLEDDFDKFIAITGVNCFSTNKTSRSFPLTFIPKYNQFNSNQELFVAVNRLIPRAVRAVANVANYNWMVIEVDDASLKEQWISIWKSHLPFSCIVYTGNKSLHCWLKVDAKSLSEYKAYADLLRNFYFDNYKINIDSKVAGNCASWVRCPSFKRPATGRYQLLVYAGIPKISFADWLKELRTEMETNEGKEVKNNV